MFILLCRYLFTVAQISQTSIFLAVLIFIVANPLSLIWWHKNFRSQFQWPKDLKRGSVGARFLELWVRISPRAWLFVVCVLEEYENKGCEGTQRRKKKTTQNPARIMDVCLLWVLCVDMQRPQRRADPTSRGVLPTVVNRCVWSRNIKNEAALVLVGLLHQLGRRREGIILLFHTHVTHKRWI
jgi:hypothetical protein